MNGERLDQTIPSGDSSGWGWFDEHQDTSIGDIRLEFKTCFASRAGAEVLQHLCQRFLDRRVAPTESDNQLRHVEGQRSVVDYILSLAKLRNEQD